MVNSTSKRQLVDTADNFDTLMCHLSANLGASTFWNPQGFSRLVREFCSYFVGCNELCVSLISMTALVTVIVISGHSY